MHEMLFFSSHVYFLEDIPKCDVGLFSPPPFLRHIEANVNRLQDFSGNVL